MIWIENNQLNKSDWNLLVNQNKGFIFDYSWYLDAVADNWGVLFLNEAKKSGIALSFTQKLGQKTLYPAFFHRFSSWIGIWTPSEKEEALNYLLSIFKGGNIATDNIPTKNKSYFFQEIQASNNFSANYNDQTKRMIKKAVKNDITIGNSFDKSVFTELVVKELGEKVEMWNTSAVDKFSKLIDALIQEEKFHFIEILHQNKAVGGLIIMKTENRHIYLKGVCEPVAKKLGGMYLAMNFAIERAMTENVVFDFGGSRIDGVARFNTNLGGENKNYTFLNWNKLPFWYNGLKTVRNKWKK